MNSFIALYVIACLVALLHALPVAEQQEQTQKQVAVYVTSVLPDADSPPAVDIPNQPAVALIPLSLDDVETVKQDTSSEESSSRSVRGLGLGGLGGLGHLGGLGMGLKGFGGLGLGGFHGFGGGLHGLGGGLGFKPLFGKFFG